MRSIGQAEPTTHVKKGGKRARAASPAATVATTSVRNANNNGSGGGNGVGCGDGVGGGNINKDGGIIRAAEDLVSWYATMQQAILKVAPQTFAFPISLITRHLSLECFVGGEPWTDRYSP